MFNLLYPWLGIAGVVAASVPIIVHLLNRRRFQVLKWAAMDFLREAVSQSRRIFELRDLLLLLLRVLCLLLFGLALARPFWNRGLDPAAASDPNQPVHAVMLVDNSLSMGYEKLDGTMLDAAKKKTRELIEALPRGSVISIVPTCGSTSDIRQVAYSRPDEAFEALASIRTVDRAARSGPVIDAAIEACRKVTNLPIHRAYLITDQQVSLWSADAESEHLKQLPCALQVVQIPNENCENAWVAEVSLRDGVADGETPAIVVAKIGYQGPRERENVQATLKVDGAAISSQTISLQPGQMREVQFEEYRFTAPPESGGVAQAAVEVTISPDRLTEDDHRSIVVPVTAALTVVFVDALGAEENPAASEYGDTYWLRRLLAPHRGEDQQSPALIRIRQLQIEQLTSENLADVRLVVVAGVEKPTPAAVSVLRQFVEQGGNVLLAAGGSFEPTAWNETAWRDGQGILPAPLKPEIAGFAPDAAPPDAVPLVINFNSVSHDYFWPEGVNEEELKGLFGPPTFFFRYAAAEIDDKTLTQAAKGATDYFTLQRSRVAEIDAKLAKLTGALGKGGGAGEQKEQTDLQRERDELQPQWLAWRKGSSLGESEQVNIEELTRRAKPVVLARYSNGEPMLVRRQWNRGKILMLTTSLSPEWTTMPKVGQAWWLMDRIVRSLLSETFPNWNLSGESSVVMPIAIGERSANFTLVDAEDKQQSLAVDALEGERFGIALGNWSRRGIHKVIASRASETPQAEGVKLWEIPLAVNGPAEESELTPALGGKSGAGERSFADASSETVYVARPAMEGASIWKWLILLVLTMLLLEMFIAARSTTRLEVAR